MRAEAGPRCHRDVRAGRVFVLAAALAVAGCLTPTGVPRVIYPFWSVRELNVHEVGCAKVLAWIGKSGKTGFGLYVEVASPDADCPLVLAGATVKLREEEVEGGPLPPPGIVRKGQVVQAWIPFFFDNEAAWNRNDRAGEVRLRVEAGDARGEVRIPIGHRQLSMLREEAPKPPPGGPKREPIYVKPPPAERPNLPETRENPPAAPPAGGTP